MDNKCYWIALDGRVARTNCGEYLYLNKSFDLPENNELKPYEGERCPHCGGIIFTDEHSYDLLTIS